MLDLQKEKIKLMKLRDENLKPTIEVINDVLTGYKNEAVKLKTKVENLTDESKLATIQKVKKNLEKEIEGLKQAGRDVSKASKQLDFINTLLPSKKTIDEMKSEVDELVGNGLSTMKDLMLHFKKNASMYDMKELSKIIKDKLK